MSTVLEAAVLRTVAWFVTMGYPPLEEEVFVDLDMGPKSAPVSRDEFDVAMERLVAVGRLRRISGRLVLPSAVSLIAERERRERFFPRKWARIQRLGRWLRWVPTVRFLAVCNTTALGAARDEADIDLFLVVRRGSLWLTRAVLLLWATVLARRPGQWRGERDAWCFSFLIDDSDLCLEAFAERPDDPYFRFWVRHLLPILDDGCGRALWEAQAWTRVRHPFARKWIAWRPLPDRAGTRSPALAFLEHWAFLIQRRFAPMLLRQKAAEPTTDVVLSPHACKTHADDRRTAFRLSYEALCRDLGVAP